MEGKHRGFFYAHFPFAEYRLTSGLVWSFWIEKLMREVERHGKEGYNPPIPRLFSIGFETNDFQLTVTLIAFSF